jgi:hypothetical protein
MTLSNLIGKLKQIQANHPMLNTFGEGNIYDYVDNGGEIVYPVMWVITKPSTLVKTSLRYNISMLFGDLLLEDKSNRLQVQSDMMQIALDVVSKLNFDNEYNFNIDTNVNIDFFQERFDDFTAGAICDITIIDPSPLDLCQIPTI